MKRNDVASQLDAKPVVFAGVVLALLLMAAVPAAASGGSACVSADIPESFVLPDGSQHAAGELSLCVEGRHSPVAHRHSAYVDGHPVGLHVGHTGESEGPASTGSYMMFGRGVDGRLRLIGYARPGTEHMQLFTLRLAAHSTADLQPGDLEPEGPIVVAALMR